VFVSYAHEDQGIASAVCSALNAIGLNPTSDESLPRARNYIQEIKALVDRVHLFVPILTKQSKRNHWVHEEIGYALGAGVPILALAAEVVPGQMLTLDQAVTLPPDLADLEGLLARVGIEDLITEAGRNSRAAYDCADDPETRTRMLAEYARQALKLGGSCPLRVRAAHSSFSLPNEHWSKPIWRERDSGKVRSDHHHSLQWEERKALEEHARKDGCYLFIDPAIPFGRTTQRARKVRLQILLQFLESMPDDKIRVAMARAARGGNLTIVGDWFFGESMSPRKGVGYLQTIFTWQAPRVLHKIREFDEMFDEYYDPSGSSRERTIEEIRRIIGSIKE
jgi:hypothetical protein